jgi:hypothetical protein
MIRINLLSILTFVAASLTLCGSSLAIDTDQISRSRNTAEASYGDTTREQILETRNRRKRQLKVMAMDARKKLADHSSGENILTVEQKEQLENKADIFQRKIESMEIELEEWVRLRMMCIDNTFSIIAPQISCCRVVSTHF